MMKYLWQFIIYKLLRYWNIRKRSIWLNNSACIKGAGTDDDKIFFGCIFNKEWNVHNISASFRPIDAWTDDVLRTSMHYQFEVIWKPILPFFNQKKEFIGSFLRSLKYIYKPLLNQHIEIIHDDWEQITLGAKGLGWEIWINGLEIAQITYFFQLADRYVKDISLELAYGIDWIAYILNDLGFDRSFKSSCTMQYCDRWFKEDERERSDYFLKYAKKDTIESSIKIIKKEVHELIRQSLCWIAYWKIRKWSFLINVLDARRCLSNDVKRIALIELKNVVKLCINKVQEWRQKIE